MTKAVVKSRFEATLLRPANPGNDSSWAFVVLPEVASAQLPRRGRTTVEGTMSTSRLDTLITSAKQAQTRAKRIANACDMLASGKKHVCCFDPSGYHSKAFRAPEAQD
ncbi:DUF1905 domain-containing protein [Pseudomonas putida]|uniref:DUF1905 domain-containing protein n=1 Tax=Pseudomonas putida TaxID=303 RepID=UPI0027480E2A|nr:YdeI/OmpD-associated family protein [Pseudomonas putida]MDP9520548.1 YdeI/OmpD-associated family protein [Pseudomonas putida]